MNHEQLLAILSIATVILFRIAGSFAAEEQKISPFIYLEIIMVLFSIISKSIWFALLIPIAACGIAVCFGVCLFLANDKICKFNVDIAIETKIADFVVYTAMDEDQLREFLKDNDSVLRKDSLCYYALASAWMDGDVLVNDERITGDATDSLIEHIYGGTVKSFEVSEL